MKHLVAGLALASVFSACSVPLEQRSIVTATRVGGNTPIAVAKVSDAAHEGNMAGQAFFGNFLGDLNNEWTEVCQGGFLPPCSDKGNQVVVVEDGQEAAILVSTKTSPKKFRQVAYVSDIVRETPVMAAKRVAHQAVLALLKD